MKNIGRLFFLLLALLTFTIAWADVEINENTFPDENFRNWILAKDYGKDGVLTDEEIASVKSIDVSNKKIQDITGIEYFISLTSLNCSENKLTVLDVSNNTKMTKLYCNNNSLAELKISKCTKLEDLECGTNQLTSFDVSQNTGLKFLSCNSNQLTSLDVSNNTELESLYCKSNQLTELDVSKNKELKQLTCSQNQLTSLDVSACTKLEALRCIRNRMTTLNVSDCPKLWEIYCFNNRIRGDAMDAFIESLPISPRKWGHLCVVDTVNEQNVMTKTQVAAAKAKDWNPCYIYGAFGNIYRDTDYEGVDEATGIGATLNDKEEMTNDSWYDLQGRRLSGKPARGIYIEGGKKVKY